MTGHQLNGPMLGRLRQCAADTSSNWDGKITIYPPEARELVALIDSAGWVPLAEVLAAVWDIDAIQRWASRSGVRLGSFIGHQQIHDYLAERFAANTEGTVR